MNLRTLYKVTGTISLIAGLAASLCVMDIKLMFLGLVFAILGFITSGISVFLNTKYEFTESKFIIAYIGMIFSSIPVLVLMFLIFRHK